MGTKPRSVRARLTAQNPVKFAPWHGSSTDPLRPRPPGARPAPHASLWGGSSAQSRSGCFPTPARTYGAGARPCQGATRDPERRRQRDEGKRDNRWQRLRAPEVKPRSVLGFWIFSSSRAQFPQKSANRGSGAGLLKSQTARLCAGTPSPEGDQIETEQNVVFSVQAIKTLLVFFSLPPVRLSPRYQGQVWSLPAVQLLPCQHPVPGGWAPVSSQPRNWESYSLKMPGEGRPRSPQRSCPPPWKRTRLSSYCVRLTV